MASDLTEDQKLVMLGLRSPNNQTTGQDFAVVVFQNNISSEWDTFQENFEDAGLTSFADFETWLTNNGVDGTTASNIRTQLEAKYAWSDYESIVLNSTSWEDYKTNFAVGSGLRSDLKTDDGQSAAGIQVYEEAGVGRAGQQIPQGGVEVYGREVHFSQSSGVRTPAEDQSADPIAYSNLTVSNTTPVPNQTIQISADITNNTSIPDLPVVAQLQIDGEVEKKQTVRLGSGVTETATFDYSFPDFVSVDVTIGDLNPITVTVIPEGL